jgi:hypothetical protein
MIDPGWLSLLQGQRDMVKNVDGVKSDETNRITRE